MSDFDCVCESDLDEYVLNEEISFETGVDFSCAFEETMEEVNEYLF